MKVYTTDEQELIMEPSIKWAGNPNITIVVKAFGLKATAQVHLFRNIRELNDIVISRLLSVALHVQGIELI